MVNVRRRRRRLNTRPLVVWLSVGVIFLVGAYVYVLLLSDVKDPPQPKTLPIPIDDPAPARHHSETRLSPLRDVDRSFYTVRINSWERPEQLAVSVNHHSQCPGVAQIQVVWCDDQKGEPPEEVTQNLKVVIERHAINSLNERFNMLIPTPTIGILSIDDDVLRPCEAIDSGFFKWTHNPRRMVGFDARLHVEEPEKWMYGYMSTTEKANRYTLSLTRYCFLHRDYLSAYMTSLPKPIFQKVADSFNCEDIAMSFFVSSLTGGRPPLLADFWAIKSMIKLYTKSKISGTHDHKKIRDECVDSFAELLELKGGPNALQSAPIQRRKSPLFECGANAGSAMDPNDIKVPRHKALVEKVTRWKSLGWDKLRRELSRIQGDCMRQAWERGLIEKSEPWKKKFGEKAKKN